MLFSALAMRSVSEELTSSKCEKCLQVLISEVLLIWNTLYIQSLSKYTKHFHNTS